MSRREWRRKFQTFAKNQKLEDSWQLEFDDKINPRSLTSGWKQYITNTGARFRCSKCKNRWPSNKVMVVFQMRLRTGKGTVKARPLKQKCKKCTYASMQMPNVTRNNLKILMENLMEEIREKCYLENLGRSNRPFKRLVDESPHKPTHCQACSFDICPNN